MRKWRFINRFALLLMCVASAAQADAQKIIKVAAAANLRYVMSEIESRYEAKNRDVDLQINYGASGMFFQQIINGAPYDLFLSADNILPAKLKEQGITPYESCVYACGKLSIYGLQDDLGELGLKIIEQPYVNRISIANPRTAPYGARSVEILKSLGVWAGVERKVVYGDSIAQAAQFAMSGNCKIGFVALSLLLNPEVELKGSYFIIPDNLYEPITQAGVVLRAGGASHLFDYMLSDECAEVWERYGYSSNK